LPNYSYDIETSANTSESDPEETELGICYGVIHFIGIKIPVGSQGELHIQLFHGEDRLAPTNPDGNYSGDGDYFPIRDFFEIETGPASLKARTWNDSATRTRGVSVHIQILPREILIPEKKLTDYLIAFLRRFKVAIS
jgi:hypothetical protein